jgi:hypothetical protein
MEKEFIPYELALALKELGFDEPCFFSYDYWNTERLANTYYNYVNYNVREKSVSAPLYQQAFRWFREKYEFEFHIGCYRHTSVKYYQVYIDDVLGKRSYSFGKSLTYEEAELECLKKLIEIVKEK